MKEKIGEGRKILIIKKSYKKIGKITEIMAAVF